MTTGFSLRRSTSVHRLSADRGLRRPRRVLWSSLNRLNNVLPYSRVDTRVEVRDFLVRDLDPHWGRLAPSASPARKLSDLFWMALPWAKLDAELGALRVIDIGCGGGRYGARLDEWSGGRIASYVGVDAAARPSWSEICASDPRSSFVEADAASFAIPDEVNLIVSQSSLEHVRDDAAFFARVRDRVESRDSPMLQLHLVPAASCLHLYGAHGVRQYTPRTLSKCTRLFRSSSRFVLFRLGGERCMRVHREFITKRGPGGQELREMSPERYDAAVREAIVVDMRGPQRSPVFLALVIASHADRLLEAGWER